MTHERHEQQAKKWIAEGKQLTGDERFTVTATDAQKRVVRVLEQSATVIKAEVSSTFRQHGCRVPGVELTYQLTRSPAHAYGQSKLASLAIMELQLSSKHDRNGTIRVGFQN
jgi:hypothetical protein